MTTARRFTVKGRVQGVFFRESTRRVAESLGLTGYAINLPDGGVEVFACGDSRAIDELESWLHNGPPMSRVSGVTTVAADPEEREGFVTG